MESTTTALLDPQQIERRGVLKLRKEGMSETEPKKYFQEGMNIGVDIDGVLVDCHSRWNTIFNEAAVEHGHDPKEIIFEQPPTWNYYHDICKQCFDRVLHDKELISSYEVVPEAEEILYWFKVLGINIHLITARPKDVVEVTKRWAHDRLGYLLTSVTVTDNKLEVASALKCKYHVEDAPAHIRAFQTQKEVTPIIWSKPYNLTLEGFRVYNWTELASLLMFKEHRSV